MYSGSSPHPEAQAAETGQARDDRNWDAGKHTKAQGPGSTHAPCHLSKDHGAVPPTCTHTGAQSAPLISTLFRRRSYGEGGQTKP